MKVYMIVNHCIILNSEKSIYKIFFRVKGVSAFFSSFFQPFLSYQTGKKDHYGYSFLLS